MYLESAKASSLGVCPSCHKVNSMTNKRTVCVRCHTKFYQRKPQSIQYTLAWTLAALAMFIPANIYPMMIFYKFGIVEHSTILEGIASFIESGTYPLAIIIFVASFIVPLGKILVLFILMTKTLFHDRRRPFLQTNLYRLIDSLGAWSMLDVFVVVVMAGVVNMGFITSIEAGLGITYFTLMVVCTMIATVSFDPRLLWDNVIKDDPTQEKPHND